jgi:MFS family permease
MYCYLGLSAGDLLSGILSQMLKSRKKVVIGYLVASFVLMLFYLLGSGHSSWMFRLLCFLIGASTGYWALFVTIASEQFGTNMRSTVTTTVPNFVRGAVVPITLIFSGLSPLLGVIGAAVFVGSVCLLLAFRSIFRLKETFHEDLDYFETL